MTFAVKAKVTDVSAKTFAFRAQKTMYGGKQITKGDSIFVFASYDQRALFCFARTAAYRNRCGVIPGITELP